MDLRHLHGNPHRLEALVLGIGWNLPAQDGLKDSWGRTRQRGPGDSTRRAPGQGEAGTAAVVLTQATCVRGAR